MGNQKRADERLEEETEEESDYGSELKKLEQESNTEDNEPEESGGTDTSANQWPINNLGVEIDLEKGDLADMHFLNGVRELKLQNERLKELVRKLLVEAEESDKKSLTIGLASLRDQCLRKLKSAEIFLSDSTGDLVNFDFTSASELDRFGRYLESDSHLNDIFELTGGRLEGMDCEMQLLCHEKISQWRHDLVTHDWQELARILSKPGFENIKKSVDNMFVYVTGEGIDVVKTRKALQSFQ
ncbi:hypothetical protein H072_9655 [Dactylellina haptotyla CBS 200.50]|uniref:Uncharacterized protein n=1 Tax=Dactylellina haptotyla (strain CBS 200.50) TaxID=1284197 RepID=S8A213_DACHA|nr:hypothetical protein H072_9655 [Dactylellina haptotyla CBS 200.50]